MSFRMLHAPSSTKFNNCPFFLVFVLLNDGILAYNLDVDNAKVFNVPRTSNFQRETYFGFSVALYTSGVDSILIVGAPRANSSSIPSVIEPGTVYQCPINKTCKEWIIDKTGNEWYKRHATINEDKSNAWIGATIAIENKTDARIVVCGPRWKNNIIRGNMSNWYMNGICYWTLIKSIKSFENELENDILPLSNIAKQIVSLHGINIYNHGMGQVGFSMHMTSNELKWDLILGSPGVFNWKGTPLLITKSISGEERTIIPSIKDERGIRPNDYFGYAVTSGHYIAGELWFAASAPRASNMHGIVILFTFPNNDNRKLIIKRSLRGENFGEYFGAALASCDLNGDGKDELLIGSPYWSKDMDEGRTYVFTALHDEIFGQQQLLEGKISGSRFGSTITCLGDIDYDGYGDIVIGAPYEGGTGAIYVFNGNSNGLSNQYTQRIIGTEFGENIRGFGISISEPRDINGDKYSDIAIGAHLSEQAIVIKSKPVIIVMTNLIYNQSEKLLKNTTFFFIDVCISYNGIYAPDYVRVVKILKIDKMYGRAYYNTEKNNDNTYKLFDTLYKAKDICSQLKIHLKKNIQNIVDPVEISVAVSLEDDFPLQNRDMKPSLYCTSCAAINKLHSKTEDLIKLPFGVDCGKDNICISDVEILLSTNLESNNKYIVGSTSTTKLIIDAFNHGEPAYQAKLCIYIPEILLLASIPPACMEGIHTNNTLAVICNLGNPLRTNRTLMLDLDMSKIRFDTNNVTLTAHFSTQSQENNTIDDTPVLTIYFDIQVDIAIGGKSLDDLYSFYLENENNNLNSVQFQHIYEVQKFGVSPIEEVILTIDIPKYWKSPAGDMQIVNINQTISYMDGQEFHCSDLESIFPTSGINTFKIYSRNTNLNTQEKFTVDTNFSINLPPENRSMYINCTNPNVECTHIKCELGPFLSSSSIAKLTLILDLYLSNFKSMMESKDIIFFLSSGNVEILEPYISSQHKWYRSDSTIVATMFLGSPVTGHVGAWTVVLSIVLGILFLIVVTLVLIKIGFFTRPKKEELAALKSQTNKEDDFTLVTTSSRENLDQE